MIRNEIKLNSAAPLATAVAAYIVKGHHGIRSHLGMEASVQLEYMKLGVTAKVVRRAWLMCRWI